MPGGQRGGAPVAGVVNNRDLVRGVVRPDLIQIPEDHMPEHLQVGGAHVGTIDVLVGGAHEVFGGAVGDEIGNAVLDRQRRGGRADSRVIGPDDGADVLLYQALEGGHAGFGIAGGILNHQLDFGAVHGGDTAQCIVDVVHAELNAVQLYAAVIRGCAGQRE